MIIFNLTGMFLILIGCVVSLKKDKGLIEGIDKKEDKLYFLYPFAHRIRKFIRLDKLFIRKSNIEQSIRALNVAAKPEAIQNLYWCRRISYIISVFFLFQFLSLLTQLSILQNETLLEGKYLLRPDYGMGSKGVDLEVTIENSNPAIAENITKYTTDFNIEVEERSYTETELEQVLQEAMQYLDIVMLGNNKDFEHIDSKLNFIKKIPKTSITVEWEPEDYRYIRSDGIIINEGISSDGIKTSVTAVLKYQGIERYHTKIIHIIPKELSKEESIYKALENEVSAASQNTKKENKLRLPETLGDYRIEWKTKKENSGGMILLIGLITIILIWFYGDKGLEEKMKKRKIQMLLDYPEIINKFTLLLNAGMTSRQAWMKIAEDYNSKNKKEHRGKRFAYEEMLIAVHELSLGISEADAYEHFGKRAGLLLYMKFGSLIAQNLKKGNKGLIELLNKEAMEAFEERKETVKRLGEEAGTKLLIPMMILLMIVFVIIMIPAFLSFGI